MGRTIPNRWAAATNDNGSAFAQMESCASFGLSTPDNPRTTTASGTDTVTSPNKLSGWLGKLPLKKTSLGSGVSLFAGKGTSEATTNKNKASSASVCPSSSTQTYRMQRRSSLGGTISKNMIQQQQQQQQQRAAPRRRHSLFGNLRASSTTYSDADTWHSDVISEEPENGNHHDTHNVADTTSVTMEKISAADNKETAIVEKTTKKKKKKSSSKGKKAGEKKKSKVKSKLKESSAAYPEIKVAVPSRTLLAAPSMMNVTKASAMTTTAEAPLNPRTLLAAPSMMNVKSLLAAPSMMNVTIDVNDNAFKSIAEVEAGTSHESKPDENKQDSFDIPQTHDHISKTACISSKDGTIGSAKNGEMRIAKASAATRDKKKMGRRMNRRAPTGATETCHGMVDSSHVTALAAAAVNATLIAAPTPRRRKTNRRCSTGMVSKNLLSSSSVDSMDMPGEAATVKDTTWEQVVMCNKNEEDKITAMGNCFEYSKADPRLAWMRSPSGLSNHLELRF